MDRLLRPRSIAVIGGQEAARVAEQCDRMGFAGDIWPVNPVRERLAGRPTYRTVADLPEAPDAAFVGVNRHLTIEAIAALAARGAGGAVCYASGFSEADSETGDGAALQRALLDAAGEMPIIGPNCYGLINYLDGALMWPDQHGGERLAPDARGVAIVTQSSNIAINLSMQRRALPLAYLLTAGNQAQTGVARMAEGLLDDRRVSALGLHVEGFGDVPAWERLAAKARALRKPIVALKVGRSEQARAATLTHTASLAGSDAGTDAFLRRLGIARVHAIPVLLETLKLLHVHGPLAGFDVTSLSCSGGEASVMADAATGTRMRFRALEPGHRARIKATLGPLVTVANPLDYHTFIWANEPAMTATFAALIEGGFDLAFIVLDFPRTDRCDESEWWPTVRAFERALAANGARGAVVASMAENLPEDHARDLLARGIVPLLGADDAMAAAQAAATIGEAWSRPEAPALWSGPNVDAEVVDLDEHAAKVRLAGFGLAVPRGIVAANVDEALAAARGIDGPVAIKALGVAHKTEAGAVRLGLRDEGDVEAASAALLKTTGRVLVEAMVEAPIAELLVGVHREPPLGLVLTLGSGGVLVELLDDTARLLLPCTEEEVRAALGALRCAPLLAGFRGRPPGDLDAVVEAVMAVVRFAEAERDRLEELDVNPLIVCARGRGAWGVDAVVRIRETKR